MFKEIVDDGQRMTDIGLSQKLTMSTLCSGELTRQRAKNLKGQIDLDELRLVTSIFSFSHFVFKSLFLHGCKKSLWFKPIW